MMKAHGAEWAVDVGGAAGAARRGPARRRRRAALWGLLAALAAVGLLGLLAVGAAPADAEGRRRLMFGPAGIILPFAVPVAQSALGQTF